MSLKTLTVFAFVSNVPQVEITENYKLNYENVGFKFRIEVQQYGKNTEKEIKSTSFLKKLRKR